MPAETQVVDLIEAVPRQARAGPSTGGAPGRGECAGQEHDDIPPDRLRDRKQGLLRRRGTVENRPVEEAANRAGVLQRLMEGGRNFEIGPDSIDPARQGLPGDFADQGPQPILVASDDCHGVTTSAQRMHRGSQNASATEDENLTGLTTWWRTRRRRRRYDLLVLCELNVDVIVHGDSVEPKFGQVDQLVDHIVLTLGSSGAITAVAASRLGLVTAVAGVVGDDLFGEFTLSELRQAQVDTRACLVRPGGVTGATVALSSGSDRAMLTSPGLIGDLTAGEVDQGMFQDAAIVHVSSVYLQRRLRPGLAALLAHARRAGAITSLDPGYDPRERWYDGMDQLLPEVDLFLPNAEEARQIAATPEIEGAAETLSRLSGQVVIKRGAQGVLYRAGERSFRLPGVPADVVDTTGAGDNFNAGFLAGLVAGLGPRVSCALGIACGARATTAYGGTGWKASMEEATRIARDVLRSRPPAIARTNRDGEGTAT